MCVTNALTNVFYEEFLNLILEVWYFKVWGGVLLPDPEFSSYFKTSEFTEAVVMQRNF